MIWCAHFYELFYEIFQSILSEIFALVYVIILDLNILAMCLDESKGYEENWKCNEACSVKFSYLVAMKRQPGGWFCSQYKIKNL